MPGRRPNLLLLSSPKNCEVFPVGIVECVNGLLRCRTIFVEPIGRVLPGMPQTNQTPTAAMPKSGQRPPPSAISKLVRQRTKIGAIYPEKALIPENAVDADFGHPVAILPLLSHWLPVPSP
jgi:hypothetical protein